MSATAWAGGGSTIALNDHNQLDTLPESTACSRRRLHNRHVSQLDRQLHAGGGSNEQQSILWRRRQTRDGMGGGYAGPIAHAMYSSLVALPEPQQLGTDRLAKGSAIAASTMLSIELARVGSFELQGTLRRRGEALGVMAWAEGMMAPSPLPIRGRWLLFLSHCGFIPTPST